MQTPIALVPTIISEAKGGSRLRWGLEYITVVRTLWWRKLPRPVILCSGDGLYGGELRNGSDLAEHAWDNNEEAPDHCSRSAVEECQTDVAVHPMTRAISFVHDSPWLLGVGGLEK